MYGTALLAIKKYLAPLGVMLLIAMSVLGYGHTKQRQGKREKVTEDREKIIERHQDKSIQERRIRNEPVTTEQRRQRVRDQRDKLRGVL